MKRYFLLLLLLQISSGQAFNNLKEIFINTFANDKLIYSICAIPLVVDLGSKIYTNKKTPGAEWNHHISTQVASGLTTGLCYFGLLYGIKNKQIRSNHSLAALLSIPLVINSLTKSLENKYFGRISEANVYLHVSRGCASGIMSCALHGILTVYYYKKII